MKKVIFMLAAAATVATSCTKTDIYEANNGEGIDIVAQSEHQQVSGEVTRAPFIGNIAANNTLEARVITFGTSTTTCDGTFNFTTWGTVTSYDAFTTGTGKYPDAASMDANYYMVGLYPHTGWTGTVGKTSALTQTITGSKDIMVAEMQDMTKASIVAKTAPTLTFKHQLTKFEVKVKAKDADAAAAWTAVTSLKVTAINGHSTLPGTFSYTLDGSVAPAFGGSASDYNFFDIDNTGATLAYSNTAFSTTGIVEAPVAGNLAVAYSMVPPFTPADNEDVTITVVADGKPAVPVKVNIPTLPAGNTAGYTYTISLVFADAETIIAEATVTDWVSGGADMEHTIN